MANTWLERYTAPLSEKLPDRDEQHLPGCLTKSAIYDRYKEDIEAIEEEQIKISRFLEMWKLNKSNQTTVKVIFKVSHANKFHIKTESAQQP